MFFNFTASNFTKTLPIAAGLAILAGVAGCIVPATRPMVIDPGRLESERHHQWTIALESQLFDQMRLQRVAFPILQAAVPYSGGHVRPYLGLYYANKYSFTGDFQESAEKQFGLGEKLKVLEVVPNSPAEMARFEKGDLLLKLDGKAVPEGENAAAKLAIVLQRDLVSGEKVMVTVLRDGDPLDLPITPAAIADYTLLLSSKQSVNAKATGKKIIINRGMLRFAETDTELTYVISHEVAHNVMQHVRAVITNYTLGTLVDIAAASVGVITGNAVGAAAAYSRAPSFESEADYVGLYIMARTGLPIDDAANFWRRIAAIDPGGIQKRILATHPASPERFVALEDTINEIKLKIASGLPLDPEPRRKEKSKGDR